MDSFLCASVHHQRGFRHNGHSSAQAMAVATDYDQLTVGWHTLGRNLACTGCGSVSIGHGCNFLFPATDPLYATHISQVMAMHRNNSPGFRIQNGRSRVAAVADRSVPILRLPRRKCSHNPYRRLRPKVLNHVGATPTEHRHTSSRFGPMALKPR